LKRAGPAGAATGELAREAAAAAIMRIVLSAALAGAAASLPLPAEALEIRFQTISARFQTISEAVSDNLFWPPNRQDSPSARAEIARRKLIIS
jgi:zona occludens toxin (predicted ATPase)